MQLEIQQNRFTQNVQLIFMLCHIKWNYTIAVVSNSCQIAVWNVKYNSRNQTRSACKAMQSNAKMSSVHF